MRNKADKRLINYIWWLVITVSTVYLFVCAAGGVSGYLPDGGSWLLQAGVVGLLLLIFVMAGLAVYFAGKGWGDRSVSRVWSVMLEAGFWLLLGILFALRLYNQTLTKEGDRSLLELALVGNAMMPSVLLSGLQEIYVALLSLLFNFLGNREIAVVYLQFILQIITVLLIYVSVRISGGRVAAVTVGLLLACSAQWADAVMIFRPEVLLMFLWSLVLCLLVISSRILSSGKDISVSEGISVSKEISVSKGISIGKDVLAGTNIPAENNQPAGRRSYQGKTMLISVAAGILCGALISLDWRGLLLLPVGFFVLYHAGDTGRKNAVRLHLINMTLLVGGAVLGAWGMFWREAAVRGNLVLDGLAAWWERLAGLIPQTMIPAVIMPQEPPIFLIILAIMSGFLSAAFWLGNKRGFSIWTLEMLLICAAAPSLRLFSPEQSMWVTLCWSILAGLGLQRLVSAGRFQTPVAEESGEDEAMDYAKLIKYEEAKLKKEEMEKVLKEEESASNENKTAADGGETIADGARIAINEKETAPKSENDITASRYNPVPGTKYIDNPLPLPRKPVRKAMDYPRRITDEKMHYDTEVSPDDDYDR